MLRNHQGSHELDDQDAPSDPDGHDQRDSADARKDKNSASRPMDDNHQIGVDGPSSEADAIAVGTTAAISEVRSDVEAAAEAATAEVESSATAEVAAAAEATEEVSLDGGNSGGAAVVTAEAEQETHIEQEQQREPHEVHENLHHDGVMIAADGHLDGAAPLVDGAIGDANAPAPPAATATALVAPEANQGEDGVQGTQQQQQQQQDENGQGAGAPEVAEVLEFAEVAEVAEAEVEEVENEQARDNMKRMRKLNLNEMIAVHTRFVADARTTAEFSRLCARMHLLPRLARHRGQREAEASASFTKMARAVEAMAEAHGELLQRLRAAAEARAWEDADSTARRTSTS
eukprot:m51a1_g13414 hypothetical protein (346) ;mRNA; r:202-1518